VEHLNTLAKNVTRYEEFKNGSCNIHCQHYPIQHDYKYPCEWWSL